MLGTVVKEFGFGVVEMKRLVDGGKNLPVRIAENDGSGEGERAKNGESGLAISLSIFGNNAEKDVS